PLMIWYGVKDRVAGAPDQAVALMSETKIPVLQTYLARRLAEEGLFSPLMTWLDAHAADSAACERALAGVADGIGGRSDLAAPPEWTGLAKKLATTDSLRLLVTRLDFAFDPDGARPALEKSLGSGSGASVEEKRLALELLAASPKPDLHRVIVPLLEDDALRADAVAALGRLSDPEGADALIAKYAETDATVQPAIVNALSGKPRFAFKLLDAVESGAIPRHAVTAYHARQIRTYKDETLRKRLAAVWGSFSQSSGEKAETIKHWQSQLTADVLAKADVAKGHEKFQQLCMACHTLKGEGGRIGPDLTGANRSDAYYLLENIIDPSATLPQDFRLTVITRGDGSVVSGNIRSENEYAIGLHTLAGEESIDVTDIAKRETLEQSIMPEGLLAPLQPDEVRDLIGFLMR
ncbi:MAG: c-type cytochrome, partial [Verrucomicrobiae bacterium]|nr:c-type cytochrome [Verrucomicrobiae bacterium]